jgi:hypothetical protein
MKNLELSALATINSSDLATVTGGINLGEVNDAANAGGATGRNYGTVAGAGLGAVLVGKKGIAPGAALGAAVGTGVGMVVGAGANIIDQARR